jgi:hypothetical protein
MSMWSILDETYTGFALFILITSFIRFKNENTRAFNIKFRSVATIVLLGASLVYLFVWVTQVYQHLSSDVEKTRIINRMTGPYWFAYWLYPFSYGIAPQVFWFRKLRASKATRVIVALLLLFVLYIEKAVILITTLHRDYL